MLMKNQQEAYEATLNSTFDVTTEADLERAAKVLTKIKKTKEMVNTAFDPIIKKAHDAHKQAIKQRNTYLTPLEQIENDMKHKVSNYLYEKRKREEAKRQKELEEMRKAEEELRLKMAKEAAEKAKQLAKEQKPVEAKNILEEAAKQIDDSIAITKFKENELQKQPIKIEKPKAISAREHYVFEIIDPTKINRTFLMPDVAKIQKAVTSLKQEAQAVVGGIRVIKKLIVNNLGR
jgi:hypothetical protein